MPASPSLAQREPGVAGGDGAEVGASPAASVPQNECGICQNEVAVRIAMTCGHTARLRERGGVGPRSGVHTSEVLSPPLGPHFMFLSRRTERTHHRTSSCPNQVLRHRRRRHAYVGCRFSVLPPGRSSVRRNAPLLLPDYTEPLCQRVERVAAQTRGQLPPPLACVAQQRSQCIR